MEQVSIFFFAVQTKTVQSNVADIISMYNSKYIICLECKVAYGFAIVINVVQN